MATGRKDEEELRGSLRLRPLVSLEVDDREQRRHVEALSEVEVRIQMPGLWIVSLSSTQISFIFSVVSNNLQVSPLTGKV